MTAKEKRALAVRCPTCGAKPGEKCELGTGQPRTEPHANRRTLQLPKRNSLITRNQPIVFGVHPLLREHTFKDSLETLILAKLS
jgi:hypothetical protein